ncbi:VWA domain-containing protein [Jannaschia sp. S6380]|uniref:vWA domain-containing protein n=1 Tax=Jannaschia sp. S6380 TaxID=2926408 RepID=UPI001FF53A01|nr:vWA domain-containing protein [Jannaschia sp. S6380]MCK0165950.1 VWA domain-containing protein [Jannaschia sp. S6380]
MNSAVAALLVFAVAARTASAACDTDAMIVFDGSASMAEIGINAGDPPRIRDAREAMRRVLPAVEDTRRIGLVTYGPGPEGSCDSVRTHFAPMPEAAAPILEVIDRLEPIGLTPLAEATTRAAETLRFRTRPGMVVVVTDGNDTCAGRPCVLAERLARDAADLTIHVIGFKVVGDISGGHTVLQRPFPRGEVAARCLADLTGGHYALPETVDALVEVLRQVLGCAVAGINPDSLPVERALRTAQVAANANAPAVSGPGRSRR